MNEVAYIRELDTVNSRICQYEEKQWGQVQEKDQFGLFALFDNGYILLMMCGNVLMVRSILFLT